jgi:hypothetical protein
MYAGIKRSVEGIAALLCSLRYSSQQPRYGISLCVHQQLHGFFGMWSIYHYSLFKNKAIFWGWEQIRGER